MTVSCVSLAVRLALFACEVDNVESGCKLDTDWGELIDAWAVLTEIDEVGSPDVNNDRFGKPNVDTA